LRIWSIHPKYLDSKGLVALWRETLLAQNVLKGNTKGYKNHPQLNRFKETTEPLGAIAKYLTFIHHEALNRNYNFDANKINNYKFNDKINVNSKQVEYEFKHLLQKLETRDPDRYQSLKEVKKIYAHPLFKKRKGEIKSWEIIA
jgi:hypothetical protein